ncbi:FAD-dependent oxidoreductase [Paludisphaera mucosa]|uniref:FAD-dependent oxidoreductase n=1 Tax=Paludisphaera mucosa TaxID=3030827 RepID=A0ABT6FJX6_9BACT|nr:FAD-dependent oxidoreductase [Paludisphaera mucosa]MDG3007883.1 FAD-dependent oxidoreductase [Paludisphaera mucosa]
MNRERGGRMGRRDFLASAAGASAYSLFVFADGDAEARAATDRTPDAIRGAFETIAPVDPQAVKRRFEGEPNMTLVDLTCDLLVAGGGPAGVCAALSAARNGAKVVLVQDRSRLGGNSSSEVKMHIVGANMHQGRPGWREGGIIEELRLDDAANNPQRSWELWDLLLYDKVVSEPNITLILDASVCAADVVDGRIERVLARCDKTEHLYRIACRYAADCTGDSRLALEAGATIRWGHEGRDEFKESLAPHEPSRETLGSSVLFTARDHGKPMPYKAPAWARKIGAGQLKHRGVGKTSWEYGYWWIEWGGGRDTIRDNERIRFELLSIVTGVWDHIKNSGEYPAAASWAMDWVGMMPGKRESRRIEGDHVLCQNDVMGFSPEFDDAVAIGGWGLDEHPASGFDDPEVPPFLSIKLAEVYNIPLRSLYSKDVANLFMAGRNASCSHVAFTSTRVMATCAVMGQAAGTAAAVCSHYNLAPRELYRDKPRLRELQQTLLRDDQTIKNLKNADPADVAPLARATASAATEPSKPEHVLDGFVRDMSGELEHRWSAPVTPDGAWLELAWPEPRTIRRVQLTFDSGFHRELTLTASDAHNAQMIRAPQPETIRDYRIVVESPGGERVEVARVEGNHQRLRRHDFAPVAAARLRIEIAATNGSDTARIYEVRAYG